MASYFPDIGSSLPTASLVSLPPSGARTADATGQTIDLIQGDGLVNVVVNVGTITDGTTTIFVQESTDASTWTNVTLNTALSTLTSTTTANTTAISNFNRTARYVRANTTAATTSSGGCFTVGFIEQKKFVAQ